jgi:hypothetical protein
MRQRVAQTHVRGGCLAVAVLATLGTLAPLVAQAQRTDSTHAHTAMGVHGMALFGGREGLYLSHLPLFRAPHDRQILLRIHLQNAAVDSALRSSLLTHPELWTIDPERFDLHRLEKGHATQLRQFRARLVQGHFEREGVERYADQVIVVDSVVVFRNLDFEKDDGINASYFLLGRGAERFLVKQLDRRPDFDAIISVRTRRESEVKPRFAITIPTPGVQLPADASIAAALRQQVGLRAVNLRTIYFETGDLRD